MSEARTDRQRRSSGECMVHFSQSVPRVSSWLRDPDKSLSSQTGSSYLSPGHLVRYFELGGGDVLTVDSTAQAWFGGQVLKTLLGSLAPSLYSEVAQRSSQIWLTCNTAMHNVFPASTHMTSADFLCFILFLLISIPLLHIPPEKFRIPFLVTAVTSTITSFSLFFWALGKAHGGGPLLTSSATEVTGVEQAHGSTLAWAVFYGISSQMGQICAGVCLKPLLYRLRV